MTIGFTDAITDVEKAAAIFTKLFGELADIKKALRPSDIDIDEHSSEFSNFASTQIKLKKNVRLPIIVEHVIAFWPTTSTAVSIQLGPRIIVLPPTLGFAAFDCRIQLEYEDDRILNIAPAGIGYLEVMGYAVAREMDRP